MKKREGKQAGVMKNEGMFLLLGCDFYLAAGFLWALACVWIGTAFSVSLLFLRFGCGGKDGMRFMNIVFPLCSCVYV